METLKKDAERHETQNVSEKLIKDLINSVGLLPEFIIEPLKKYIKEEVTYRLAQEVDFLAEKKIEVSSKRHTLHHIIIMALLLTSIVTMIIVKYF
jgi:hypothetical protein